MLEHSVRFSQLEAMVDLHCLATWKTYVITKRGKKIRLSESQLLRSVRFFELRWKRSEKWIRGFFGKMKEK